LVRYVDAIADKRRIGQAFAGMLLLGGITSLPEIAAVSGASWVGNAPLSISNLLGSLCMNLVLLSAVDALVSKAAITSVVPGAETLLQGPLGIVALALTASATATSDVRIFGIAAWSFIPLAFFIFAFWLASRYAKHSPGRADRSVPTMPEQQRCSGPPQDSALRFALPDGREVNIDRTPRQDERYAKLAFAVSDAFKRARRQLQDHVRRLQSQVTSHERP
jgi:cation:H+ antiporter